MSMAYGSWSRARSSRAPRTSGTSGPAYPEPAREWGAEDAEGGRSSARGPREPSQEPRGAFVGRDKRLLGILKDANDPHFNYFELQYLQWIHKLLTEDWALVQWGHDLEATNKWVEIFSSCTLAFIQNHNHSCINLHEVCRHCPVYTWERFEQAPCCDMSLLLFPHRCLESY